MRLLILLSLLVLGCNQWTIRSRDVYVAETIFTDRLLRDGAAAARSYVLNGCTCEQDAWRSASPWATDLTCRSYAEWWFVYASRWSWHHSMMLFNARIIETRPPAAGPIPPVSCNLPTGQAGE